MYYWTEEQEEKLRQLYNRDSGLDVTGVAERMGMSYARVSSKATRLGLRMNLPYQPKMILTMEQIEKILSLRWEGKRAVAIAKEMGLPYGAVVEYVRKTERDGWGDPRRQVAELKLVRERPKRKVTPYEAMLVQDLFQGFSAAYKRLRIMGIDKTMAEFFCDYLSKYGVEQARIRRSRNTSC